jgi:hypothetical protein
MIRLGLNRIIFPDPIPTKALLSLRNIFLLAIAVWFVVTPQLCFTFLYDQVLVDILNLQCTFSTHEALNIFVSKPHASLCREQYNTNTLYY